MTNRTTMKDLEGMVSRLNRITNNSLIPWETKDGRNVANVGTYVLGGAYGGWKLAQLCNEGGGQRDITLGYSSKADCYRQIAAYVRGIEDCIRGEQELNQKIAAL